VDEELIIGGGVLALKNVGLTEQPSLRWHGR
jgi:hypothetical protein